MSSKVSRRNFLRGSLAAAGGLAASGVVLPSAVKAASGKELATMIDLSKCVGCEACVDACHEANEARYPEPRKPFPKMLPPRVKAEDWSEDRGETERLTPYNWVYIQRATGRRQWRGAGNHHSPALHALPEPAMREPLPLGRGKAVKTTAWCASMIALPGRGKMQAGVPLAYSPAANGRRAVSRSAAQLGG